MINTDCLSFHIFCFAFFTFEIANIGAILNEPPHDKTNKMTCEQRLLAAT